MSVPVEFVVIGVLVAYGVWSTRQMRMFRDWWFEERFGVDDDEEGESRPRVRARGRDRCARERVT